MAKKVDVEEILKEIRYFVEEQNDSYSMINAWELVNWLKEKYELKDISLL